jgi:hypothetical protein
VLPKIVKEQLDYPWELNPPQGYWFEPVALGERVQQQSIFLILTFYKLI